MNWLSLPTVSKDAKSGEPYILHPIEVAIICVEEIGLGRLPSSVLYRTMSSKILM